MRENHVGSRILEWDLKSRLRSLRFTSEILLYSASPRFIQLLRRADGFVFRRRFRRQFGDVLSCRFLRLRIAAVELVRQQMFRPQHQGYQDNQQRIHFPAGAIEVHVAFDFVAAARQVGICLRPVSPLIRRAKVVSNRYSRPARSR